MGFILNPYRFGGGSVDVGELAAWYDASDSATITEAGGEVTAWADKSDSNYDLGTGTSPSIGTVTQNSLDTVTFEGSEVLFSGATSIAADHVTMYMMFRMRGTQASFACPPVLLNPSGSNAGRPLDRWDSASIGDLFHIGTTQAGGAGSTVDLRGQTSFAIRIIQAVRDAGGAGTHHIFEWVNTYEDVTAITCTATWSTASQTVRVGRRGDGSTQFRGDVGEIRIYDAAHDEAARQLVLEELADKWAITL